MKSKQIYEFGPFRLDPDARLLWRNGERLNITPKVFDMLHYMADNPGRLLTKEELLRAIWPDRFVEESNLAQNVSVLRRALSEVDDGVKYIATFHGRGYQFLAQVRMSVPQDDVPPSTPEVSHPPLSSTPTSSRAAWIWTVSAGAFLALAAAALLVTSGDGEQASTALVRLPLTRLPGSESQPALTRDGTKHAFVWDQERLGLSGVFVKGADDGEPRRVAVGVDDHASPAWSPDGRQIAYLRPSAAALQVMVNSERGGQERLVTELYRTRYGLNCRHLDWSPDGRSLVVDDKEKPDEPLALFLVDLVSGAKSRLTKPVLDIIGHVDPHFSPDGQMVSFIRMTDRFQHELAVVPIGGGAETTLVSGGEKISGHDWSEDGKSIVFASNRSGGEYELWMKPLRGGSPRKLGISSANPIQLAVARSGGKLVYSDVLQDLNVWRLDLHGAAIGKGNWSRVIASTAEDILPQLSPDGSKLCFRSDRSGQDQLWISDAEGSRVAQLTNGSMRPVAGRWSPDSRTIVFHGAASARLFTIDAGGGSLRSVGQQDLSGGHPIFSLDGRKIFYNADGLRRISLDGKGAATLTPPPVHEKALSRDGKYLYFTAGRTDPVIWRLEFSTGITQKSVTSLLPGYWGAWALGERSIYYLADEGVTASIRRHDIGSGKEVDLAAFPGPLPPIGTSLWSLSPDERWLYCVRVDISASDLMELRGFR